MGALSAIGVTLCWVHRAPVLTVATVLFPLMAGGVPVAEHWVSPSAWWRAGRLSGARK